MAHKRQHRPHIVHVAAQATGINEAAAKAKIIDFGQHSCRPFGWPKVAFSKMQKRNTIFLDVAWKRVKCQFCWTKLPLLRKTPCPPRDSKFVKSKIRQLAHLKRHEQLAKRIKDILCLQRCLGCRSIAHQYSCQSFHKRSRHLHLEMTKFATVNVPAVTSKLPGLAVLINRFDFDIVAIQEADVDFPSRASFRSHCLKLCYPLHLATLIPEAMIDPQELSCFRSFL